MGHAQREHIPEQGRHGDERPDQDHALQAAVAAGWAPVEAAHLGGWRLGASSGFTRRANSVVALADPGIAFDEAVARVEAWYAERALPALIQAVPGSELDRELAGRGWGAEGEACLMTAPLAEAYRLLGEPGAFPFRVALARTPEASWLERYHKADDHGPALAVLTSGASTWFATLRAEPPSGPADPTPNAIGRCVVDGRFAGFAAIEVAPESRRRGAATAVMAALVRQALTEGAETGWLQVEPDNLPALTLYRRLGFTVDQRYHYRRAPAAVDRAVASRATA